MQSGGHFKNEISINVKKMLLLFAAFCISAASIFAQDIITLKNGEDIQSLVQEIGDVDVKYKKYENPDGPNYTLKKAEIFMIRYANGSRDVFVDNTAETPTTTSVQSTPQGQPTIQNQATSQSQALSQRQTPIVALNNGNVGDGYGSKLSNSKVRELMRVNPVALATYERGLSQRRSGKGLAIPGYIFVGISSLISITANHDDNAVLITNLGCLTTALAFLIPAAIIINNGNKKVVSAVGMYNNSIQEHNRNVSLNFGITQSGGVGLALNF